MIDLKYTYDSKTRDKIVTALETAYLELKRATNDALFARSYQRAQELDGCAQGLLEALEALDRAEQA